MSELGPHGGFILAAYLATVVVIGGLVCWVILDGRAIRRRLKDLEARGIRRRSASKGEAP